MPLLKSKRWLSLLLALVLIATGTCFTASASYQSQINELEQKQAELKQKINALQGDINEQAALRDALQERIDAVQSQIDIYNGQMDDLQDKIDEMENEKAAIEEEIAENKKTFLARVRAMYMGGSDSALTVLLSADDYADYLYQSELLASITEYDHQITVQLKEDVEKINALEAEVEKEKAEIASLKAVVDEKRAELNEDLKSYNAVIDKLEGQQGELEMDLQEYQKQIDALEAKIQAASSAGKEQADKESIKFEGGQFKWPTPGFYYISSNYGYRWGRLHKGVDIAGSNIYGTPIVAAADGVVSLVDNNYGGYGLYVMINHGNKNGNNYVTLYAHMSKQAAYVGQKVKAGDTIGYVGNTGRSTGPHLHFEIRVNGTAQNPMNWF